jgi:pantoate--beta-alanine ligase
MHVAQTIADIRRHVRSARSGGKVIGFVPTMGALHEGHASLIDAARQSCGHVVVSIFVNPTQFGPGEDLARYPRTPRDDAELCEAHGADLLFVPSVREMYAPDAAARVTVDRLDAVLCGASRPGHFAGVCTVVAKLFNIVQPDRAFFGAKDYQQLAIIRRMVRDLDFPVEVIACPTVRGEDGLALSSRNAYLAPRERAQAPALHEALSMARGMIAQAPRPLPAAAVRDAMLRHIAERAPLGVVDYAAVVDPDTLQDVETIDRPVLLALAVRLGQTRLIDNMLVDSPAAREVK